MPAKYHIPVKTAPSRFPTFGRSTILDWGEGCLRCARCVKEVCPHNVYEKRTFDETGLRDTIDSLCKNCFRCVQGCPRELVTKILNPQYQELGDDYWTPEIILSTYYQAETGKIPVSGAGYGGPFAGEGFDALWTDMSEIVRPTRDGIHGREYISTAIDLGRHPLFLVFDERGELAMAVPPLAEIPLPVVLAEPPFGEGLPQIIEAAARAARILGTFLLVSRSRITPELRPWLSQLIPSYPPGPVDLEDPLLSQVRLVEFPDSEGIISLIDAVKARYPELICQIRVPANGRVAGRVAELTAAGAEILRLVATAQARGLEEAKDTHLKDLIRQVHLTLVDQQLRDSVTLLASGGIAMAEHVAKAIICGVDGVIADQTLLVALECRLCGNCQRGEPCPVRMAAIDPSWGAQRLVNLMAAWNNQLLEVLGAMGMREVRRLRGEVGRAMFVEELQKEIFVPLFARPGAASRREGE